MFHSMSQSSTTKKEVRGCDNGQLHCIFLPEQTPLKELTAPRGETGTKLTQLRPRATPLTQSARAWKMTSGRSVCVLPKSVQRPWLQCGMVNQAALDRWTAGQSAGQRVRWDERRGTMHQWCLVLQHCQSWQRSPDAGHTICPKKCLVTAVHVRPDANWKQKCTVRMHCYLVLIVLSNIMRLVWNSNIVWQNDNKSSLKTSYRFSKFSDLPELKGPECQSLETFRFPEDGAHKGTEIHHVGGSKAMKSLVKSISKSLVNLFPPIYTDKHFHLAVQGLGTSSTLFWEFGKLHYF